MRPRRGRCLESRITVETATEKAGSVVSRLLRLGRLHQLMESNESALLLVATDDLDLVTGVDHALLNLARHNRPAARDAENVLSK